MYFIRDVQCIDGIAVNSQFAIGKIHADIINELVAFHFADGRCASCGNCSCVSVSDKEFARLHSKYNLKKEDVLEVIKAYAQELGLEYGPVNYFMMCDPKYANDLGEVVQ